MNRQALEIFTHSVLDNGEISRSDVRRLQRDILPDGIESRDEADILIALDRAVADKDPTWSAFVIQGVVDYVVWSSRPTGAVDRETAQWLTNSLTCGTGPTDVALAIAFETVRESQLADEILVSFVMRWTRGRHNDLHALGSGERLAA